MSDRTARVLDLDALAPEPFIVTLGGRDFDVAGISLGVAMEGLELMEGVDGESAFRQASTVIGWVTKVLQVSDPDVDADFVLRNVKNQKQLGGLLKAITDNAFGEDGQPGPGGPTKGGKQDPSPSDS